MRKADEGSAYTQRDIIIVDSDGNQVCVRPWWNVPYDPESAFEEDPILFGNFGYYGDWE